MKVLSAVCLILGCFLGAGFVSGREVASYFSNFGTMSYVACVVAGVLFFVLTNFFFNISNNARNTNEFLSCYFNRSKKVVEWLFAICVLIITGSMFAGTYSLADSLGYNEYLIVGITFVLTFVVVCNNVRGLERVNTILVPILILVIFFSIKKGNNIFIKEGDIISSILSGGGYVFINIVSLGLLIIEISHNYSKREKILISLICTMVIMVLLTCINFSILSNGIGEHIMPNLYLSSRNPILYVMMQISIYLGLFTTLISNAFLLSNFANRFISNKYIATLFGLILGVFISLLGFNNLVGYVYIFIAGVGVFVVCVTLIKRKTKGIN